MASIKVFSGILDAENSRFVNIHAVVIFLRGQFPIISEIAVIKEATKWKFIVAANDCFLDETFTSLTTDTDLTDDTKAWLTKENAEIWYHDGRVDDVKINLIIFKDKKQEEVGEINFGDTDIYITQRLDVDPLNKEAPKPPVQLTQIYCAIFKWINDTKGELFPLSFVDLEGSKDAAIKFLRSCAFSDIVVLADSDGNELSDKDDDEPLEKVKPKTPSIVFIDDKKSSFSFAQSSALRDAGNLVIVCTPTLPVPEIVLPMSGLRFDKRE